MSQQNIELARETFEHFRLTGEPALHLTDPEVAVYDHDIMDGTDYHGHEGVIRWLTDWATAWSQFSLEPEEFIDAGERVVVVLRLRATGRSSGASVDRQDAMVQEWRDGKVIRLDYYNDPRLAREVAGLEG